MKKILIMFVCIVTFITNVFAQEIELKMVQIETSPIADVTKVKNIEMLEHEVTLSLYESVMGDKPQNIQKVKNNNSTLSLNKGKKYYYQETGIHDNHPVVGVTFYDAIYFCNKLSKLKGLEPVYSVNGQTDVDKWDYGFHSGDFIDGKITQNIHSNGYRLPTEIEWLYASKGGENFLFAGSDVLGDVAWYKDNSKKTTHEIKQKKPNGFGLYDMLGNVKELTYKTNLSYAAVQDNKKAKENLGKTREDGSIITFVNLRCPLYTAAHGKSYKSFAKGFKDILYKENHDSFCYCDAQENDLGFRIVRTVE